MFTPTNAELQPRLKWGENSLTHFIEFAGTNVRATFEHAQEIMVLLSVLDESFQVLAGEEVGAEAEQWLPLLFFLNAHSHYRAAVQMSMSGHIGPVYPVLRGCIEQAIYGFFLARHPDLIRLWLSRHESKSKRNKIQEKFRPSEMISQITNTDSAIGGRAKHLYDLTIDYGAHPNERGLTQILATQRRDATNDEISLTYLDEYSPATAHALRITFDVGVFTARRVRSRFVACGVRSTHS